MVKKSPEPTFDKQLLKYSKDNQNDDDPIFSHAYHDFITNLLKTRDKALTGEIVDEFNKKVAEHYDPIMKLLNKMDLGQELLVKDMSDLKIDIGHMKCDIIGIRQQVASVRDNYERLEIKQLKIMEEVESINYRTNDRRMWLLRIILVVIAVILALGLFIWVFPWVHNYRMLSLLSWT